MNKEDMMDGTAAQFDYYKEQLARVKPGKAGDYAAQFQLRNGDERTNWLGLNAESASKLVAWLKEYYDVKDPEVKGIEQLRKFYERWKDEVYLAAAAKELVKELRETRDFFQTYVPLVDHNGRSLASDWNWEYIDKLIDKYESKSES